MDWPQRILVQKEWNIYYFCNMFKNNKTRIIFATAEGERYKFTNFSITLVRRRQKDRHPILSE